MKSVLLLGFLFLSTLAGFAQSQKGRGYPSQDKNIDVRTEFINPPKGYGNVPFYWWNGDTLNQERLKEQLDILSASATDGFAVSYIHTDPAVDTLFNKNGYGLYGKTEPGRPQVFSDEWWKIWNWFSGECARRNLGAGLDDYTVGWIGNGYYPDELASEDRFKNYKGELVIDTQTLQGGETFTYKIPDNLVTIVAWPGKIELTKQIKDNRIVWQVPEGKSYKVYIVTAKEGYVLHPDYGKELVNVYFNRFESKMDQDGRAGMNYFFQDELSYPIKILSWSDDFQQEFKQRKGYDLTPYLPALKEYIGTETPRIRLDYCEVLFDLAEERYFKPIYNWHAERGLIYGCDNLSRGRNPLAYIDYFRAISWFTAPGNDAPARGSSFLETKISSSISHVYNRPRTWLEAFHSMGWGSSGEWLTQQIDHHFIAGGNLVCMHGLYYSTHGGWWEWAPPCFHFRMPYWPHMKQWLKYVERMSYILSQGQHVCDIALMYPTESMQAYPDATPKVSFDLALQLSNAGLDYDFIDFRSLRNAVLENNLLQIGTGKYKVLILADMKAMHFSSLQKILAYYRSGGIVLATGQLPQASNRIGEQDKKVNKIVKEIFGLTTQEAAEGKTAAKQKNAAGGIGWYVKDGPMEKHIATLITPDFIPAANRGKVLHRKIGEKDLYMIMNVEKGSQCFFRSKGKVELWDAITGTFTPYPVLRQTDQGTYLQMEKDYTSSYLIVFSPGTPEFRQPHTGETQQQHQIDLNGKWEIELLPTLNNKWGDFRFPAFDGYIGAEARSFHYSPEKEKGGNWQMPDFDDSRWEESLYGYGPQAEMTSENEQTPKPVVFSWQWGVWDNPGSQGYHGLKGKISDGFFILSRGKEQQFRTSLYVPEDGTYQIIENGVKPEWIQVNNQIAKGKIYLQKGWHPVHIKYAPTPKIDYKPRTGELKDDRERSAVVFLPDTVREFPKPDPYSQLISTRWGMVPHLMFDPYGGKYKQWNYRFKSVPGLEEMDFEVHGKNLKVWINGQEISTEDIRLQNNDPGKKQLNHYKVFLPSGKKEPGIIAFSIEPFIGYQGSAVIAEPVKLKTGIGLLSPGNWSESGALKYYSGGMYYRKVCNVPDTLSGMKALLNLGNVVATCEVKVNGNPVGILMSPPYETDITKQLHPGENKIEVLVYSTLSNHYQSIPTPYRGDAKAGLLGPVSLSFYKQMKK